MLDINDRPRERIIKNGVNSLSNVELLAVILGSGTKEMDVMTIANYIISNYGINKLKDLSYYDLIKIPGVKMAKACHLLATFELVKRSLINNTEVIVFDNSKDIFQYLYPNYLLESKEKLMVLYLNSNLSLLKESSFYSFVPNEVIFPIRKIIEEIVSLNATGIVLAHNHPSGNISPSINDKISTKEFVKLLINMNVTLVDHLIIYKDKYFSFVDNGILEDEDEYDYLGDI